MPAVAKKKALAPVEEVMSVAIVGHVDHGKSTVLGRLLADTQSLPPEKIEATRKYCQSKGKPFEFAFLIDALHDERAQGITIDAARIFLKSDQRRYLILDNPGHVEFVKNMVTGASRAEAALLVIDAKEGIQENSKRHGQLLSLLGIRQITVVINKMDLVGYDQLKFNELANEYSEYLAKLDVYPKQFIPVSGIDGANVVERSKETSWYFGPTVLESLDGFTTEAPPIEKPLRFPIQDVYKFSKAGDDRRLFAGTIESGKLKPGTQLIFYPSKKKSAVKSIESLDGPLSGAQAGEATAITLTEELYVERGEVACALNENPPQAVRLAEAHLFWLDRESLKKGREYLIKVGTSTTEATIEEVKEILDVRQLDSTQRDWVETNECAKVVLRFKRPVALETFQESATGGRFVIVSNYRLGGGGIVLKAFDYSQEHLHEVAQKRDEKWIRGAVGIEQRREKYAQKEGLFLITGKKESPRKDIASLVERQLLEDGKVIYFLGMGNVLYGVGTDVGSSSAHRLEHIRRMSEIAHILLRAGVLLLVTAVELTREEVEMIQTVTGNTVKTVWVGNDVTTNLVPDLKIDSDGKKDSLTKAKDRLIKEIVEG